MTFHNIRHGLEDVNMEHVVHRNVDGNRQPFPFRALPAFQDRRRFFPDIPVKAMNLTRILQDADELPGREETLLGMIPTHERFRAEQFALRRNLRLQIDDKLTLRQPFLEAAQDLLFAQRALHQGVIVERHPVPTLAAQEGERQVRTVAHDGNGHLRLLDLIDAEMDVQLVGAAVKSLSQEFQTFEKLLLRAVRLVHVGGEVIAMQAGCRTRVHRQLGKEPRQAFQHLIALLLAEKLVDKLEILDIRANDAAPVLHAVVKLVAHGVVEAFAVIKTRELVARPRRDFRLHFVFSMLVANDVVISLVSTVGIEELRHRHLVDEPLAFEEEVLFP